MAKDHESAFFLWRDRLSALRCQAALVRARGNHREAARLIGLDHTTLFKILQRNDQMLLKRADAEGWKGQATDLAALEPPRQEQHDHDDQQDRADPDSASRTVSVITAATAKEQEHDQN
jgi:hypothetical protein